MQYKMSVLTTVLLAGFLVGCGSSSEPSVTLSKLSGVAVDDLIVNGDVVVYPVGKPSQILKRGKTDGTSGAYSLELSHDGVVVVEVTCGSEGKMKNSQTGVETSCEQGLKLHSAAALSPKVKEVEVNISPLTDAVVAQMEANGGDKVAFEAAQKNIGEMFGFDPIAQDPVEHDSYSKTVASMRELAKSKNTTMMQVVEALNDDLSDGQSGDDGTIATELAKVMKDKNVNTKFAQNDGVVAPDAEEVKSDIEVAKTFFTELRTQARSVIDFDNSGTDGFLDTEAKDLGDILKNETLNVNIVGEYATDVIDAILNAIDANETTNYQYGNATVTKKSDSVWEYAVREGSGTVTLPAKSPKDIDPANFTTLRAKFEGALPLNENGVGSQRVKMDAVLTKTQTGANLEVKELSIEHNKTSITFSDLKGVASYDYNASKPEDERVTAHFVQFDSGKVVGKVDGYELNGELAAAYVVNDSVKNEGWESVEYWTHVSASVVCADTGHAEPLYDAEVVYTDKSGVEHQLISSGSYFNLTINGNVENLDNDDRYANQFTENYIGQLYENATIESNSCTDARFDYLDIYRESDRNWYNSGKLPKSATFTGSIKNTKTAGEISGELHVDWIDAATFDLKAKDVKPHVKASIVGKIKMPSRPEMLLNIGYENPKEKNVFTFAYAYDATTINGAGSLDKEGKNGMVDITTHEGLKFHVKIENGDVVYGDASPVTRNGRRVGTLEERESVPVIKYTDDTFESLL